MVKGSLGVGVLRTKAAANSVASERLSGAVEHDRRASKDTLGAVLVTTPWDERIKYDVYYVERHGFWMDIGILFKTVLVVARGDEHFAKPFAESLYADK